MLNRCRMLKRLKSKELNTVTMEFLETSIDKFVELLKEREELTLEEASEELDYEEEVIEDWAQVLEKHDVIEINYGISDVTFCMKDVHRNIDDEENYGEVLEGDVEEVKEKVEKKKEPDYEALLRIEEESKNREAVVDFLEDKIKSETDSDIVCIECGEKFDDVDVLVEHIREKHAV